MLWYKWIGHNGTVVCMLCPKISTSLKKLAPTGRHGRHVFATVKCPFVSVMRKTCLLPNNLSLSQYWKRQNELYGVSYFPHVTVLRQKHKKGSCWFKTVDINFLNYPLMVKSCDGSQARDTENQNKIEEKSNLWINLTFKQEEWLHFRKRSVLKTYQK